MHVPRRQKLFACLPFVQCPVENDAAGFIVAFWSEFVFSGRTFHCFFGDGDIGAVSLTLLPLLLRRLYCCCCCPARGHVDRAHFGEHRHRPGTGVRHQGVPVYHHTARENELREGQATDCSSLSLACGVLCYARLVPVRAQATYTRRAPLAVLVVCAHSQEAEKGAGSGLIQSTLDLAFHTCLLYTSPSPRDATLSRMPSSA